MDRWFLLEKNKIAQARIQLQFFSFSIATWFGAFPGNPYWAIDTECGHCEECIPEIGFYRYLGDAAQFQIIAVLRTKHLWLHHQTPEKGIGMNRRFFGIVGTALCFCREFITIAASQG